MLAVLRNSPDSMSMSSLRDYIDPNMMDLYPHDCVFKVNLSIFTYYAYALGYFDLLTRKIEDCSAQSLINVIFFFHS